MVILGVRLSSNIMDRSQVHDYESEEEASRLWVKASGSWLDLGLGHFMVISSRLAIPHFMTRNAHAVVSR